MRFEVVLESLCEHVEGHVLFGAGIGRDPGTTSVIRFFRLTRRSGRKPRHGRSANNRHQSAGKIVFDSQEIRRKTLQRRIHNQDRRFRRR